MKEENNLIAPCGMNCGICMAFLRKKNKCNGCRALNTWNPKTRLECKIKNCIVLNQFGFEFCFECENYPCKLISHMDKRYKNRYGVSTIENMENIKEIGLEGFKRAENIKWKCNRCGGIINVHKGICNSCGEARSVK